MSGRRELKAWRKEDGEGHMWYETGQKMKQGQAWDWSGAEAQGGESCSGQTWFQKAKEHKYEWAGGASLGMQSRMGDGVS